MQKNESKQMLTSFLAAISGLILLVVSGVLAACNINSYLVLPFQFIGNVILGIGLIGFFLHIKQNQLLKWTSLIIGFMYILNLFAVNALIAYMVDNYDIFKYIPKSVYVTYLSIIGAVLIFFGISFLKLYKVKKIVGVLAIFYILIVSFRLVANLLLIVATNVVSLNNIKEPRGINIEEFGPYLDLISYGILLAILVILLISQRNRMHKSLKVKTTEE